MLTGKWHKPYHNGSMWQKIFENGKVGHIVQDELGKHVAMFDGCYLGRWTRLEMAMDRVDHHRQQVLLADLVRKS